MFIKHGGRFICYLAGIHEIRLPRWFSGKESTCHCRVWSLGQKDSRKKEMVFLPGKFHGQRSLAGYSPWGHKESDMTKRLTQQSYLGRVPGREVCLSWGSGEVLSSIRAWHTVPSLRPDSLGTLFVLFHLESYKCSPWTAQTGQTWCPHGESGPPGVSGLAPSAPYSTASMLAVPVAGPVVLAAMPGLLPIGSLCPGKGCEKAWDQQRAHLSASPWLGALGHCTMDTRREEFLAFPWARLESQRLQVVGDSWTFSPTHGTLWQKTALWEGKEGWTIKWGKH